MGERERKRGKEDGRKEGGGRAASRTTSPTASELHPSKQVSLERGQQQKHPVSHRYHPKCPRSHIVLGVKSKRCSSL